MAESDEGVRSTSVTEGGRNELIFTWVLENYSCCGLKRNEKLASPFFIDRANETEWACWIYPNGSGNDNYVSLYLSRGNKGDSDEDEVSVGYALQILNPEGISETSLKVDNHPFAKNSSLGFSKYIAKNDLCVVKRDRLLQNDRLVLRARIWKPEGNMPKTSHCLARTRMHKKTVSYVWTVDEFSSIPADSKKTFLATTTAEVSPQIKVDLSLQGGFDRSDNLKVEVTITNSERLRVVVASICAIEDDNRSVEVKKEESWLNSADDTITWTLPSFCSMKFLSEGGHLRNDALRFSFRLVVSEGVAYETVKSFVSGPAAFTDVAKFIKRKLGGASDVFQEFTNDPESEEEADPGDDEEEEPFCLSHDFRSLRQDAFLSDVTLKAGPRTFPAHRSVLSARSPVFRAMFASGMREGAEGVVQVEDIDGDTLARLLDFFYTDSAEDLRVDTVTKLYAAADKYQVQLLKKLSGGFLSRRVCADNACQLLLMAHADDKLKSAVVSFVETHRYEVCGTDSWMALMKSHPGLAAEVMFRKFAKG